MGAECPQCKADVTEDDLYCSTCGARLVAQSAPEAGGSSQPPAQSRFPGADVVSVALIIAGVIAMGFSIYAMGEAAKLPGELRGLLYGTGFSAFVGGLSLVGFAVIIRVLVAIEAGIHQLGGARHE